MTATIRQLRKAARIILVGAPGVGKGTQTERLLARYPELASISSGDLLRENVRRKTPLGLQAEATMQSGNLVPDSMILDLISSEFKSRGWLSSAPSSSISPSASFILDGFPRTATQASSLETIVPVNFVVHLVTPPSVILSRIASRWVHEPSGRVYNTDFNAPKVPGKDDVTGEPLTQREDDSIDTWKQRLHKFEETSKALLEHYQRKGCLWRVEGDTSDEISPKLFAEIERQFC
ncbi:adenylate kinase ADK2 [Aspergillus vadensis CBS 113365]|uniref:GTP:AMP phosphotransferase, mitochondrial n=2 Tax=Aspergillus subgen. Circumdati TaxID=2720871 RepID=A0A319CA47_ASPVC|nr:adenylate kinase 2 [Aspergillus neoniger CBS 115656]XP_025559326.1 adenylate kinase 2 [Aspergillus vadensis CBS 113365]PYH36732.1 adenylate kinase 2 [Aspergillus neoniger CBS 115656]PYH65532.1 adenylate kinase 2 [Aspergillus vadensis CBS 113365]